MGAQTVRYLQYLLSIDYFNQNKLYDNNKNMKVPVKSMPNYDYRIEDSNAVDRSSYIASLSTLNGMMNGGTGPASFDPNMETNKMELYSTSERATGSQTFS